MNPRTALLALPLLIACHSTASAPETASSELAPAGEPAFEVLPLEYSAASDTAEVLTALVLDACDGSSDADVRILADERTNSLVVMARPARMAEIRDLVARLDVELAPEGAEPSGAAERSGRVPAARR